MDFAVSHLIHKLSVVVVIVLLILAAVLKSNALVIVDAVILLLDVIQFVIFFRCPYCKKHLGSSVDKCPYCGEDLQ